MDSESAGLIGKEARAEGSQTGRPLLRLSEVAQLLGLGRSTLYRMAHEGRVPVVHRPGGMYVPRASLDAYLAAEAEAALENLEGTNGRPEQRGRG